jgi:hypothetical protein
MHGSRSKIPSKKSRPYKHDVKFLALLEAPYIYDISRLRVKYLSANFMFLSRTQLTKTESGLEAAYRLKKSKRKRTEEDFSRSFTVVNLPTHQSVQCTATKPIRALDSDGTI